MADLYGLNCHDSSHESEDMSSFLHNLLQGSSAGPSSASPFSSFKNVHSFSPPPTVELGHDVASGAGVFRSSVTVTSFPSDSDFRFSDLGGSDGSSSMKMNFPPEDDVAEDFDFCYEVHNKASEDASGSTGVPRSSKRTRAAEIHNLSEKRRRSRINEKLKALQTLIPNSNKTDKASMLDDAIEYLKQLQLQVQMLTRRNGLSLRPAYVREQYQPIQRGVEYDDEVRLINPNGGGTFSLNQEISLRREFDIPNYTLTNPQTGLPSLTNIAKSEAPFGLESSAHN